MPTALLSTVFCILSTLVFGQDTTPPVFAAPPPDVTVECIGDIPPMIVLGWTDNVDGTGMVTGSDAPLIGGACGGYVTRTWTYTDMAGNNATVSQTITVNDTQPPTASAPDTTYFPLGGMAPPPDLTDINDEADNCSTPAVAHVGDVSDGGSPCETITRTYSITDDCGNQILVDHILTSCDSVASLHQAELDFLIYPNPTSGPLSIRDLETEMNLEIYQPDGQIIEQLWIPSSGAELYLDFPEGLYLLRFTTDIKTYQTRIVITN